MTQSRSSSLKEPLIEMGASQARDKLSAVLRRVEAVHPLGE
jgi:hypothetical protein